MVYKPETFFYCISLIFLFLFFCTDVQMSGGATETVNTRVAGLVFQSSGEPAENALVRLIPSGQAPLSGDTIMYETRTDQDGSYVFEIPSSNLVSGHYNLMIVSEDQAFCNDSVLIEAGTTLNIPEIFLDSSGSVTGYIRLQDRAVPDSAIIAVTGTGLYTIAENGIFTLTGLPSGRLQFRISAFEKSYIHLDTVLYINAGFCDTLDDTIVIPAAQLLMEDFDDGDGLLTNNRTDLGEGINSFWYIFKQNDSTSVLPAGITDYSKIPLAIIDTGTYAGKSLLLTFILSDMTNAFAGLGCRIAPDCHFINLKKMTALTFFLKGRGRIRVNFTAQALNRYPENQRWGTWGKTIECPPQWEKIEVIASELLPQEFSQQETDSLFWNDVCDSVENLQFSTSGSPGDTIMMYLDEIRFRGVLLEDIELTPR